jgi:hypothetical protein
MKRSYAWVHSSPRSSADGGIVPSIERRQMKLSFSAAWLQSIILHGEILREARLCMHPPLRRHNEHNHHHRCRSGCCVKHVIALIRLCCVSKLLKLDGRWELTGYYVESSKEVFCTPAVCRAPCASVSFVRAKKR